MRGFRAKDADRDRFVELIEAAYVDGQLGDADRELRVGRALSAETLDELETLTRDLQLPAGYVPAPSPATAVARPPGLAAALVALVVVVALIGVGVVSLVLFASSDSDYATSTSTSESTSAVESPAVSGPAVVQPDGFTMTPADVRAFLRAYERQFGTLDVYEVAFYPTRVGVQAPVRGSRPRFERWTWEGAWRQDTEASAVIGPGGIIDLGGVDVRRLFANIATARKTLGVQRGKLTHVLVNDWSEVPTVNIYIGNSFNESGYLKTTLSGEVLRRFPYDS